jgi:hypothetical protein
VYPLAINHGLMTNRFGAQPMQKPPENIYPVAARQMKWKAIRQLFVSAAAASQFPSSYKRNLFKRTSGTYFLGSHIPPILSNLVAKLYHYQIFFNTIRKH